VGEPGKEVRDDLSEHIIVMPDADLCPRELKESLTAYSRYGRRTGDFLRSCLENDLYGAVSRADPVNLHLIPHIVAYIHWELPALASGGPERVRSWIERGGLWGKSHDPDKA
jgi:hypothetical protein